MAIEMCTLWQYMLWYTNRNEMIFNIWIPLSWKLGREITLKNIFVDISAYQVLTSTFKKAVIFTNNDSVKSWIGSLLFFPVFKSLWPIRRCQLFTNRFGLDAYLIKKRSKFAHSTNTKASPCEWNTWVSKIVILSRTYDYVIDCSAFLYIQTGLY